MTGCIEDKTEGFEGQGKRWDINMKWKVLGGMNTEARGR